MTLMRGLDLLKTLADGGAAGLGIGDICERRGLHRVTAHRLLAGLIRGGWVEQDEQRKYHLGVEAWRIGISANKRFDLIKAANASLDTIEQVTQDTTFLLKLNGGEALCVARREGTYLLKFLVMDVGVSYPLGVGAATLAILAHLTDEECAAALRQTETKLTRFPLITPALMRTMLEETRERGFALSTGFIAPGATAVAVPIFGADGRPVGSFTCAASPDRLSGERLGFVVHTLLTEAKNVSARLGYGGSPNPSAPLPASHGAPTSTTNAPKRYQRAQ